jgi:iron complex outermembrane receptor protein
MKIAGHFSAQIYNYSMRRIQAVVNVPLADTFRVRLGFDRMTRHGYLNNIGLVGDGVNPGKDMGDVNYYAGRLSVVGDLTPNLESYLVATYSHSKNNGVIPTTTQCFPRVLATSAVGGLPFGDACVAQRAREAPYGPWTVENRLPISQSKQEQWQIIHALTWQASDSLTIKNIMSYGEFRSTTNLDLYGNYFVVNYNPAAVSPTPRVTVGPASGVTSGNQVTGFAFTSANPFNGDTNAQSSFVEELRFQYHPDGGKLMLQGGLYAEINNPIGPSGVQTATLAACADIQNLNCAFGSPNFSLSSTKFRDYAVYAQGTYSISDKLKFTAGLRYTWDKQISDVQIQTLNLATQTTACTNTSVFGVPAGPRTFPIDQRYGACHQALRRDTSAPTWLLGLDYKPVEDVLLYAKYSRGYRQGGLSLFSPDTTQSFDKERVDTYEAGAKTSWHGSMPGSFNISGFYNKFANQQLLLGVTSSAGLAAPSASVVNAGKSYMLGFETELNISPFDGFHLGIGYAYLKTKLQAFVPPTFAPGSFYDTAVGPLVGGPIPNSIPHKLTVSASYTLPLDASIGKITLGGTFIYTSAYQSVADGCPGLGTAASPYSSGCYGANFPGYPIGIGAPTTAGGANVLNVTGIANPGAGRVPGSKVVNLSVNWENVAQLPVDASFFVTNVTNEVVYLNVNENTSRGFRSSILGEPRMFGFRLKYRFGN